MEPLNKGHIETGSTVPGVPGRGSVLISEVI